MKWDRTKRGNVNLVQQYMSAGLSPAAAVEKAYPSWPAAKKQQLIAQMSGAPKTAGYLSEIAGQLVNPGNWFGVTPAITGGAALGEPTRSSKEQAAADEDMWKNLLIPGVAPYHAWKRLGYSIRGKELKEERERRKKKKSDEKEREELEKWQMTVKEDDPDIDERGRRLKKLQDDDAKDKEHVKLAAPSVPGAPDSRAKLLDHIKYMLAGGVGGATLGGLAGGGAAAGGAIGGLYGLLSDPGKDEKGKRRSRLMRALKGIVYGGGLGALGGLAGGAGAALGGYYGGKSGLRFGDRAFSERSASAMRTTNRDKEAEAACRVISKVTSLVKDPKKHKWLDDSREGFGHWAGPPSVAKGDTEPKNVKEAHPGLTHKEWKALKGQRHDIQKSAGVSREALGAILGALLGGAGGYHMANQMAEPGSAIGGAVHPWRPGYPSNWKEGLMGAAATGIPSAALGGYIGRALTPKEEEEEEEE